jgi:hypothetical protein
MPTATQIVRPFVSVILLAVTALGLINVYGDNQDVKQRAQLVACGGKECSTQLTRLERTPLAQTFDLVAEPRGTNKGRQTVTIRCARSMILLGDWECLPPK